MSIDLPEAGQVFLPEVPDGVDVGTKNFLEALRKNMIQVTQGLFHNDRNIADVVDSGTSGTFVASGGNTITVTNGIITGLS